MSAEHSPEEDKKVTAAITDAPQEEFISPTNVPTRTEEEEADKTKKREKPPEPPRH